MFTFHYIDCDLRAQCSCNARWYIDLLGHLHCLKLVMFGCRLDTAGPDSMGAPPGDISHSCAALVLAGGSSNNPLARQRALPALEIGGCADCRVYIT